MGSFQGISYFYRSQTTFAKVMFLHVSVILSTGEGGFGVPGQVHPLGRYPLGRYTPRGRYTPWVGTPPGHVPPGRYTPWQVHLPPPRECTPQQVPHRAGIPPWAGTPPGQVHPPLGKYTPRAGTPPGQIHPREQCMLGDMSNKGGTHPTGMHSCYDIASVLNFSQKKSE